MSSETSVSMRLFGKILSLVGSDLKGKRFPRLRNTIATRAYPVPARMPARLSKRCHVDEDHVNGHKVYTLTPHHGRQPVHIVYTHGGAYVFALQALHWSMIDKLIALTGASVTVPIYPLAPEHTYQDAFNMLYSVYMAVLKEHADDAIALCGDSAGGGLALAQALNYRDKGLRMPDHVVLFSPWLDISMSNPGAAEVEASDALLGIPALVQCGQWWAGGDDPHNPLLSPIFGDLSGLPPIDVFQGTADVLVADARLLQEKVLQSGGRINLYEYPGAFHDFILASFTPEARHAFSQVKKALSSR